MLSRSKSHQTQLKLLCCQHKPEPTSCAQGNWSQAQCWCEKQWTIVLPGGSDPARPETTSPQSSFGKEDLGGDCVHILCTSKLRSRDLKSCLKGTLMKLETEKLTGYGLFRSAVWCMFTEASNALFHNSIYSSSVCSKSWPELVFDTDSKIQILKGPNGK